MSGFFNNSSGDSSANVTKTALSALGGHRAVYAASANGVSYADNTQLSHRDLIVGITTSAANLNEPVTVKTFGEMTEESWNWIPGGLIFVGENGLLTQTPPTQGFIATIATAISATKINIRTRQPIVVI